MKPRSFSLRGYTVSFSPRFLFVTYSCSVILLAWSVLLFITEAWSPPTQLMLLYYRCSGLKTARTVRQFDTDSANFYLKFALKSAYPLDDLSAGKLKLPTSWAQMVSETGNYRGPHLRGSLRTAYPFLREPLDPWGRPWIFHMVEIRFEGFEKLDLEPEQVDVELTFGSLGPDGLECPPKINDASKSRTRGPDWHRYECDDLLNVQKFLGISRSSCPPNLPVETRPNPLNRIPEVWW